MVISGCRENLYDSFPDLYDRYVERSAAQIVHHNFLRFSMIQSVREGRAGRLIDNTLHIKSGNPSCVFCRLSLDIIEICRYCDNCFCHFFSKEFFRVLFQLHQDHCTDRLRFIFLSVNAGRPLRSHTSLYRCDSPVRIRHRLPSCRLPHQTFAVFRKGYDTRSRHRAVRSRYDHRLVILHNGNAAVCRSQVYSDYFTHNCTISCHCVFII